MVINSTLVLLGISGVFLGIVAIRLWRVLQRAHVSWNYTASKDAPSVSVCIPARNETHAMTDCLQRVLASDYEKMEIIVFDDSSVDNTSVLIKSFAHEGVRFIPGLSLQGGWLGKNRALGTLARDANGTYILFLDVDTVVKPDTISRLVSYMITKRAAMLSVIPGRADVGRVSVLFGHLRYFWELVLSRPGRPATSSSLWMIKRQTLLDTHEGFKKLKTSIAPEATLAALLGPEYHFLITTPELGVTYEKKWRSQAETAKRLLYPKVGSSWRGTLAASLALFFLNVPLFVVVSAVVFGWGVTQYVATMLILGYMATYGMYTRRLWSGQWLLGALLWPIVILQEWVLFIRSVVGYAKGTITWKGRQVSPDVRDF